MTWRYILESTAITSLSVSIGLVILGGLEMLVLNRPVGQLGIQKWGIPSVIFLSIGITCYFIYECQYSAIKLWVKNIESRMIQSDDHFDCEASKLINLSGHASNNLPSKIRALVELHLGITAGKLRLHDEIPAAILELLEHSSFVADVEREFDITLRPIQQDSINVGALISAIAADADIKVAKCGGA
jgi:hypothetical protein